MGGVWLAEYSAWVTNYSTISSKVQHPKGQGCQRSLANDQNVAAFLPHGELSSLQNPKPEGQYFSRLTKQISWSLGLFSATMLIGFCLFIYYFVAVTSG